MCHISNWDKIFNGNNMQDLIINPELKSGEEQVS